MKNAWWIARKEFAGYFRTPIALVFLLTFVVMSMVATYLWGRFFILDEASLRSYFYWLPYMLVLFVPAVGMRFWCEERRQGTIELLLTMPIEPWEAVWGKFIAGILFMGTGLAMTFPMVITVEILGAPDYGVLASGYIGALLLSGSMLAGCSLLSALTSNQVISYVAGAALCLAGVVGGHQSCMQFIRAWFGNGMVRDLVAWLSVSSRFETFQRGVIELGDCVYLVSLSIVFLYGTELALSSRRGKWTGA